jgi:hypothetical protein
MILFLFAFIGIFIALYQRFKAYPKLPEMKDLWRVVVQSQIEETTPRRRLG